MRRFWDTVVEPILEILKPRSVVEIGSGEDTPELLEFCLKNDAKLYIISLHPQNDISKYGGRVVFHQARGIVEAPLVEGFDAVFIGGGREPRAVLGDLKEIEARSEGLSGSFPLVIVHGAEPPSPKGGAPAAVEDFLRDTDLRLEMGTAHDGGHGLCVLVPSHLREQNKELAKLLGNLDSSPTGAEPETVRGAHAPAGEAGEVEALRSRLRSKEVQMRALNREVRRTAEDNEMLIRWIEQLRGGILALLRSRQWLAARVLGELHRRATRQPRTLMAHHHLDAALREFNAWRSRPPGAEPRPAKSGAEAPIENPLTKERVARKLAEVSRDYSRRAGRASKDRLAREARKLKPRMSKGQLAGEIRGRLGPPPELGDLPPVSIIVSSGDGRGRLERLLSGLRDHTDYPNFEVIVVDAGTGAASLVRSFEARFPVKLAGEPGKNSGAERARGELLLFMEDGAEPFEAGWLRELVGCRKSSQAGVVGAYLVDPRRTERPTRSGYAVRLRGVKLRNTAGSVHPRALEGDDALGGHLGEDAACPAVSGACLLVESSAFESVGGFAAEYRGGGGDVDLCLRLASSGRKVVSSGRAVLFHDDGHGSPDGDWRVFEERWDARLSREYVLGLLGSPEDFWTEEKPHIAITVTSHDVSDGYGDWYTAHEIGDALENHGWRVSYLQRKDEEFYSLPDGVDYVLALLHWFDPTRVSGATTIAWIRNWTERWVEHPWFEHFDMVLASSSISKDIVERRTSKSASLFPIAANPERFARTPKNPSYEADYVFTGNHWGGDEGEQRLVEALDVAPDETVRIFGKGWEHVPKAAPYARGHIPYEKLPQVYSSTKLAIDDAGHTTRPYGSVNSRVFDALAAGTLVVTSCEAGAREIFDEDFPTYGNREELRANLDHLLGDEARREELASRYRDIVLRDHTYERRAGQLAELLRERAGALSFCIKIAPRDWERAPSWGDLHYARAVQRQLERRGHPCLIQTLEEWDDPEGNKYDVAVHLRGLEPYATKPGQLNVLWNISHPELLTAHECGRYDLALIASERWAKSLRAGTSTPVHTLLQATDPEVFFPEHDPLHDRELVFVGNSRKVERRILRDLLPTDRDLAVWGKDWEGLIDSGYVLGNYLPNEEVRKAYSSASIVLNDHWDDMREYGFVSNRIYDALACGALVISDEMAEIGEAFGDAVVTYRTPEELGELVDYYLSSPGEREEKGRRGREMVLARHTFGGRVEEMLRLVGERMGDREFRERVRPLPRVSALHGGEVRDI
ncbi:MAG: glycosyltransferase [Actinomycetota bacterium]|nr:glycosyltransferase [Actinomycetota bacterium]